MIDQDKEEMEKALEKAKEQFAPLISLANYLLEIMATSEIPHNVALFIGNLKKELVAQGFTREEAMAILTSPSLDIVGLLKQDNKR